VQTDLKNLKTELNLELQNILSYWMEKTIDAKNGGFIGQIDYNNTTNNEAEKGSVLNARLLWTFSAAYKISQSKEHLDTAKRAFEYLSEHFYDSEFGGIFWSIHYDGAPKDTKNQIYALAFAIYGLSEYYSVTQDEKALNMAVGLYQKIQEHSYDAQNGGYLEAFTRDWQPIDDLRLSEKDANEKKNNEYPSAYRGGLCQFIYCLEKRIVAKSDCRITGNHRKIFYQYRNGSFKVIF